MAETERSYPNENNLGKSCAFWHLKGRFSGCNFPKVKIGGRTSCEGIIDDVCLFLKDGRPASSLTQQQRDDLKARIPYLGQKPHIPAGEIR